MCENEKGRRFLKALVVEKYKNHLDRSIYPFIHLSMYLQQTDNPALSGQGKPPHTRQKKLFYRCINGMIISIVYLSIFLTFTLKPRWNFMPFCVNIFWMPRSVTDYLKLEIF